MQLCNDSHCDPICDFCYYFRDGYTVGRDDVEDGVCVKHNRQAWLTSKCDDYVCFKSLGFFKSMYYLFIINRRRRKAMEKICAKE